MGWIIYETTTGEIVKSFSGDIAGQLENGQSAVEGDGSWLTHLVVDGQLTVLDIPRVAPTNSHKWNRATASWDDPRTLEQVKASAWEAIKAQREARMNGTFTHAGNTYDIDPVNLSGASIDAREALIAEEVWSQMWVLADNTVVTLTAAEMIALGRACKTVVSNLWGMSQYLRGLVDAATTVEEVEAVVWP